MFGSNDDKKAPAAAGEKKGLFSWFRKKPQQPVAEQPQAPEPQAAGRTAGAPAEPLPPAVPSPRPLPAPLPPQPACARAGGPPQPAAAGVPLPVAAPAAPEPACAPAAVALSPKPVAPARERNPRRRLPFLPARRNRLPLPRPLRRLSKPNRSSRRLRSNLNRPVAAAAEQSKPGFFARLKQGLSKTSASIGEGMASLFLGKKVIDDDLLDEIETRLLTADVGVEATSAIVQNLTQKVARKQLADADALYKSLQEELAALLRPVEQPLKIEAQNKPYVILVVGVNGAGKTTTIGKLAKLQLEGKKVMLAAGDTFRAAAVEQLQVWGERNRSR
jgi:fused signal recognition particle receptor